MNDIDKIPSKCLDCPYWELASYPWYCGDCVDKMNPKNSEYIKRIDAKRALTALPPDLDAETVQRCVEAINNPKAADVEPKRKMGRWIAKKKNLTEGAAYMIPLTIRYFVCSLCGREEDNAEPYCNCGAKMDAEPPKEGQTDE